jgi:hypothetical protein
LTPAIARELCGLQVFGRSLLAASVGGDAFDFIPYPDSQIGLSIADAKGKGLPAAPLAVAHRAMLHSLVGVEFRLRATFSPISDLLARSLPAGNAITTFYGIVDIPEGRVRGRRPRGVAAQSLRARAVCLLRLTETHVTLANSRLALEQFEEWKQIRPPLADVYLDRFRHRHGCPFV